MIDYAKYLSQLNLTNIKQESNHYGFLCPFCQDSKKRQTGRNAYILGTTSDRPYFYCHRCGHICGEKNTFGEFLQERDYFLYEKYIQEVRSERLSSFVTNKKDLSVVSVRSETKRSSYRVSEYCRSIDQLHDEHVAKVYLRGRKIPEERFPELFFFAGNAYAFFQKLYNTDKYSDKNMNAFHVGILSPQIDRAGNEVGFVLRFLNPVNDFRFLNLFLNKEPMFFGEQKVNFDKPVHIVEGFMDKMSFVDDRNVLAMLSTNQKIERIKQNARNVTYIYDYEYLNTYIHRSVKRIINSGMKVFLWDQNVSGVKDINDLKIKYSMSDAEMFEYIRRNTFSGFMANLEFNKRVSVYKRRILYGV